MTVLIKLGGYTHWKQTLHLLTPPLCKIHLFPNPQPYIVITLNHCILPDKSWYSKNLFDLGCNKKKKISKFKITSLYCFNVPGLHRFFSGR